MNDQFQKEFKERIYYAFLGLKLPYEVLRNVLPTAQRELKDFLAYDIWRFALDGFIIRLDSFCNQFADYFEKIRGEHRHKIKRNYWKEIKEDPNSGVVIGESDPARHAEITREMAIHYTNQRREDYKKLWDKLFPSEISRAKGFPSDEDLSRLIDEIRNIGTKISDHRNTVSAHPDCKEPKPATWSDIDKAMKFLQDLVHELGLAFFDINFEMQPNSMGANSSLIAKSLTDLIFFDETAGEQTDEMEA